MENVQNRVSLKFIKRMKTEKNVEQHSKLTFNGIDQSYTFYDSYTIIQNVIILAEPFYLRFTILGLLELLMNKT